MQFTSFDTVFFEKNRVSAKRTTLKERWRGRRSADEENQTRSETGRLFRGDIFRGAACNEREAFAVYVERSSSSTFSWSQNALSSRSPEVKDDVEKLCYSMHVMASDSLFGREFFGAPGWLLCSAARIPTRFPLLHLCRLVSVWVYIHEHIYSRWNTNDSKHSRRYFFQKLISNLLQVLRVTYYKQKLNFVILLVSKLI